MHFYLTLGWSTGTLIVFKKLGSSSNNEAITLWYHG